MATTTGEERFTRTSEPMETTTASPVEQHAAPTADTAQRSGKATASFIVGIIALLTSIIPVVGLVLGIVALALGTTSRTEIRRTGKTNAWMAVSGIAVGAIACVVAIAIFAIGLANA